MLLTIQVDRKFDSLQLTAAPANLAITGKLVGLAKLLYLGVMVKRALLTLINWNWVIITVFFVTIVFLGKADLSF